MQNGSQSLRRYACSVQPHLPAAAFCTQCRRPYAGRYLSVLMDGRAVCYRCLQDQGLRTLDAPSTTTGDYAFQEGWWGAITGVIRTPTQTIGRFPTDMPVRQAMVFGFVMCLIGALLPVVWATLLTPESVDEIFQKAYAGRGVDVSATQMRALFLMALPFAAAFKLFLGSVLLHVGIRVSGARDTRFAENARAFALSAATLLFGIVPAPFGLILVAVVWSRVMMRWVYARYQIPPLRALFALLPALLLMAVL